MGDLHITLYTLIGDFKRVKKALIDNFADMTSEVTDSSSDSNKNEVECFTLHLKDDSDITFNINHGKAFIDQHISGMYNFFAEVKCDNQKLHQGVLKQIEVFNCVASSSFELDDNEYRSNYIVNAMLAAAKDVTGLVLMPDMRLFNGDGKLVFSTGGSTDDKADGSTNGISDFEEYIPIGNADFVDSRAKETPQNNARRERSIAVLKEKGIPYFPHLRSAVMEAEARPRPPEEIARRLFAMFGVCAYSETRGSGETWEETQKYLRKINDILGGGLDSALTAEEKAFLAIKEPEQNDLGKFGWRYECCHVLMWALGISKELGYPSQICDVSAQGKIIWRQDNLADFLKKTKPRAKEELLDAADLILRYDWACVDARVKGGTTPAELNGEVVVEWHYALNWLIGACDNADWDDIKANT